MSLPPRPLPPTAALRRAALLLAILFGSGGHASPARAADALVLEVREAHYAGVVAYDLRVQLTPKLAPERASTSPSTSASSRKTPKTAVSPNSATLSATVDAARIALGGTLGTFAQMSFTCPELQLAEPVFGCASGLLRGRSSVAGAVRMRTALRWRSDRGTASADADGQEFAGGTLAVSALYGPRGWTLQGSTGGASIAGLRSFMVPWFAVPKSIDTSGKLALTLAASGRDTLDDARIDLQLDSVDFGNADATVAGEQLAAQLHGTLQRNGTDDYAVKAELTSDTGQALAGAALFDFKVNPLQLDVTGHWRGAQIELANVQLTQRDLSRISGNATLRPAGNPYVQRGHFRIEELRFPAAYTSFLQIALATSDFGTLVTRGTATGDVDIANDAVTLIDASLDGIDVSEKKGKFSMQQLRGALHWTPAQAPAPQPSWFSWQSGNAYGLSGGATRLDFIAQGFDVALTKPASVPILDGALRIDKLAAQQLATAGFGLQFVGEIEPISMPLLSRAFGWPEMSGQLAGRIPGVTYRDKLLTFDGDVEARVFDGRIVGSNIRLQDPLGPWPRLFADVRAHNLDLALVTRTFSIGSITGRLDADILGLELFNWSPVAFDASLRTPPDDPSRHRISAKAVGDLSNIGGGGGGVVKALQSGAFRLFDEYDYARIGLRCKLVNGVCLMSGVRPAKDGYYILQGKGLPHIDIIGNAGRVNWHQLVSQIVAQMSGEGKVRVE